MVLGPSCQIMGGGILNVLFINTKRLLQNMENFNAKNYRDNLAHELKEIRKTDRKKAQEFLETVEKTEEYQEAKRTHQKEREGKKESGQETIMSPERKQQYQEIFEQIKNSPIEKYEFEGNTYFCKLDAKLPYGECHYARVFAKIIYYQECVGNIKPGDLLLETTSGSGGRAAAQVATALGYKIKIAIPAGGEKAREDAIIKAGGMIELTPAEKYVDGFPTFVTNFLKENPDAKYLSHVTGRPIGTKENPIPTMNEVAINAFRPFVDEVIESGIRPDIVICPLGNGTTTYPIASEFKSFFGKKCTVIGFEAVSSALAYRQKYPGKYERIFDNVDPAIIPRHDLPGTTAPKVSFAVPALDASIPFLDHIGLVTSDYIDSNFEKTVGFKPADKSDWVVKWDDVALPNISSYGRTGKAGFAVAAEYARKNGLKNQKILVPVFDSAEYYDK